MVVDDDPEFCSILQRVLQSEAYSVETAVDVESAWGCLIRPNEGFDAVILDRRMPEQDGIELLKRIKGEPRFAQLPVIMQTGASTPRDVLEGIEAGAYYYLTKPYEPRTLLCVLRSAIKDAEQKIITQQSSSFLQSCNYINRLDLAFATLESISKVCGILTALCPDPDKAARGLHELLLNAVEHGNLGITYEEKKQLMIDDHLEAEILRRQVLPEYRDKLATVTFARNGDMLEFKVADQGEGFDWSQYLELQPERLLDPNGRGIAMARRYSFDSLEYLDGGRTALAKIYAPATDGAANFTFRRIT